MHLPVVARARLAGKEPIAPGECARMVSMQRLATKRANVRKKIRRCVIRGRGSATARPDGAACYVIDLAHS